MKKKGQDRLEREGGAVGCVPFTCKRRSVRRGRERTRGESGLEEEGGGLPGRSRNGQMTRYTPQCICPATVDSEMQREKKMEREKMMEREKQLKRTMEMTMKILKETEMEMEMERAREREKGIEMERERDMEKEMEGHGAGERVKDMERERERERERRRRGKANEGE